MTYFFAILLCMLSLNVYSQSYQLKRETHPLLEVGAGFGYADLPQYEGSRERRSVALPFPTVIYRGDYVRADEDGGLRSRLKFSDRFEVNASFGLSLPVDSDQIEVRESMPDLDPLLEIGPGFIYHILGSTPERPYTLSINFAARYTFTTDLDLTQARGWVLNPIAYSRIKINDKFSAFLSVSQKWAEKDYQRYYYDVPEEYATSDRSPYTASGGILSTRWASFLAYQPTDKMAWATGLIYFNYANAANRDSPLHVMNDNFSIIFGFTYWFYQSEEMVKGINKVLE